MLFSPSVEIIEANDSQVFQEQLVVNATYPLKLEHEDSLGGSKGKNRVELLLSLIEIAKLKMVEPETTKYWQDFPSSPQRCFHIGNPQQLVRVFPSHQAEGKYSKSLATIVSNTYPKNCGGANPICDKSSAVVFDQGRLVVITTADGCNWGEASSKAAEIAVDSGEKGFLQEIQKVSKLVNKLTLQDIAHSMMISAHEAEKAILKNCSANGTTTYLQTIITAREDAKIFDIGVYSVGDMKAYLYRVSTNSVVEITRGNRPSTGVSDPGGRLGKYPKKSDLRNAQLYYCVAEKGDLLIQVSDGIHDCLSASLMGVSSPLDSCAFAEALLEVLLKGAGNNPSIIAQRLITHAWELTAPIRELMEGNANASQPKDQEKFPGKADHILVTVARIG